MNQKKDKIKVLGITGAAFGCILFLLSFMLINFRLFPIFNDSDMFVDLYPAKLMWEQKKLFPENWVFGNQYFTIASPVWTALFYGITGKLCFSMALSVTLLTLLICAAWLWMLAPLRRDHSIGAVLLSALLLLGGMIGYDIVHTQQGQIFFLCTAYYASYLLTLFVVYGCYARDLKKEKITGVMYVLALALCFATGMQSLRQTAVMVLPLGCVEVLRQLLAFRKNKKLTKEEILRGVRTLGYAITNAAGFLFIKIVIKPAHHNVYGNTSSRSTEDTLNGVRTSIRSLLGTLGLLSGTRENAATKQVLFLLAMVVLVAALWALIKMLRQKEFSAELVILLLFWIGILGVLLPGCLFNIVVRPIYYFTWYPLAAFSLYYVWETAGRKQSVIGWLLAAGLGVNYLCSYLPSVLEALRRPLTEEQEVVSYLEEHNISYLYGDWSYVLGIAMTADGRVIPGGWYFDTYQVLTYVNPLGIYGDEDNDKALILLTEDDNDAITKAAERGVTMQAVFATGKYTLYKADAQLMYE